MAKYGTLMTQIGITQITKYLQEGGKLGITEFAVGDGGGAEYKPTADMTALRNERWRGAVNSVRVSDKSPNAIVIEAVVPDNVGGFTIREAGVFDAQGNLIGIMNTPQTEKVAAGEGALAEQYIEMTLVVSSTEAIELTVDSSLVMATKQEIGVAVGEHNLDRAAHQDLREAIADMTSSSELTTHNTDTGAHQDIRTAAGDAQSAADTAQAAAEGAMSAASAAQSTADSAMQKTGGNFSGPVIAHNNAEDTSQIRNITIGTADLTAGSSSLDSGSIYLVYS